MSDENYFELMKSEQRAVELRVRAAEQLTEEAARNFEAAKQHLAAERQGALQEALGFVVDRLPDLEPKLSDADTEWKFKGALPVGFRLVPRPKSEPPTP